MMRLGNMRDGRAFSLIEMLTVIAIIAIIAGIVLGVMPGVMNKKTVARVQTELTQLQAAIEYYKEKHGFYPPDNTNNSARPPLFYELVGTVFDPAGAGGVGTYTPLNGEPPVTKLEIANSAYFRSEGFLNSSTDGSEVKNFYPTIRRIQYKGFPTRTNVMALVVPAKGPGANEDFNPWRYIVAKPNPGPNDPYPTNNPGSFDLWAEVVYGGRTNKIGNWKQ
jgi:prepilin-type N-terminal cleavage/methylation domain-containing protein